MPAPRSTLLGLTTATVVETTYDLLTVPLGETYLVREVAISNLETLGNPLVVRLFVQVPGRGNILLHHGAVPVSGLVTSPGRFLVLPSGALVRFRGVADANRALGSACNASVAVNGMRFFG